MKLNNFSKGLSTRLDPTLIGLDEAVVYTNIDNTRGTLKSALGHTVTATAMDTWFYLFKDIWYSGATERSYIEYKDKLYYTDTSSGPQKVVNETVKPLGIEAPITAVNTVEGAAGSISASGETLQYTYTYYDSNEGIESAPAPLSTELTIAANKQVDISDIAPSLNPTVDTIRLYRVGAGATEFTLLIELAFDTTTYTDNIPTLSAIGTILATFDNQAPAANLRYLTQAYGIMFGAVGDKLVYSKIGEPDAWPTANNIDFAGELTGILPTQDGILVFTATSAQLLLGSNTETFKLLDANTEQGCNSHKSCKIVNTTPVWSSADGICALEGGVIKVLSKDRLGKTTFDVVNTAVYDEHYYICLADGSMFALDLRFGLCFKSYEFPALTIQNVGKFNNILYAVVDGYLATLFDGDELEFEYTSPELTEGDATVTKMYNNIYVRANGDFTFKTYIDAIEVASQLLTGDTIHDITMPQEEQRGSSIQFNVVGTGTIKEIEFKVIGRQNGR